MSRVDASAREACEAVALPTLAELVAASKAPLPELSGTTVRECLALGAGAAIVHDAAGVKVVASFDPEAATPTVLATHAELHAQIDAGATAAAVGKLLLLRERGALLALRGQLGRGPKAVAA